MAKKSPSIPRREDALSRDRIVEAAIELLDSAGEPGLTFRALSDVLATGPGSIYWHIANKSELLVSACDALIARTMASVDEAGAPEARIRAIALGMFAAMDEHPWIGSALLEAPGQSPMVRLFERIGQQVQALGVPDAAQWTAASTLLHYILGVGGQNAGNRTWAQTRGIDRAHMLGNVSAAWRALNPTEYPFTRAAADQLRDHDDLGDFVAGIDLILSGLRGLSAPDARRRPAARNERRP
jgi:AcrR family transcriptional regulator